MEEIFWIKKWFHFFWDIFWNWFDSLILLKKELSRKTYLFRKLNQEFNSRVKKTKTKPFIEKKNETSSFSWILIFIFLGVILLFLNNK